MTAPPTHPYRSQPDRAFWARSVSRSFDARALVAGGETLIRRGDKVVSAGSCFASNLAPYIERAGLHYFRTEAMHPAFAAALRNLHERNAASERSLSDRLMARLLNKRHPGRPSADNTTPSLDNFGYAKFSAAYGNIYTVRQLLQLLRRATGSFRPTEGHWAGPDVVVDPFRPGLRYKARTVVEHEALTRQHLCLTKDAFLGADVFVVTLGLTEAWISTIDGAVFPACPGTVGGAFDASRHAFVNFSISEITEDLQQFILQLRGLNPGCRFILTVSPVPLVATATSDHVLCASTYSKSVLRVAAQEVAGRLPAVTYFPAYEIVTGPQAPKTFLAPDRREVRPEAVAAVMAALLSHCETASPDAQPTSGPVSRAAAAAAVSSTIIEAECEEAMSER